jgi:DNA (cytosine-5)-methyltransferase 1
MKAIELFAGAGGLALGVSRAGSKHELVIEIERNATATIHENQRLGVEHVRDWPFLQGDVRKCDYSKYGSDIDLLAAGAPCQPFSISGKWLGQLDDRNMFPEVLRAMRELNPKVVLVENVKGLVSSRFREYLDYVVLRMRFPEMVPQHNEDWVHHLERLRACVGRQEEKYTVGFHILNAADFGVPQWRERVFIVAVRADLEMAWHPPSPTHGLDSLLWSQWFSGEYWDRHGLPRRKTPTMTKRYRSRLRALLEEKLDRPKLLPWRTVRDGVSDLLTVPLGETDPRDRNHFLNPGARQYAKHTGSPLDEPAKTLKAGGHGVPGGENSVRLANGRIRYFSVRECARLQAFPDDYVFSGTWSRQMRQLGNAVPVTLAEVVAGQIRDLLSRAEQVRLEAEHRKAAPRLVALAG